MRKWATVVATVAALALFYVANRAAWQGYFADDDLDNISWTTQQPPSVFLEGLALPRYFPNHFRPVGHFTYHVLGSRFGLDFRPYIGLVQLLHLISTGLVYLLLRRLKLDPFHAGCGALFFLFHMALFPAIWKPMYLFDVWCGLFCLLSLVLYLHGRLVLSLIGFWFAYKSKELAVALPLVLGLYEYLLGGSRWRRVAPFAAIAAMFTLQGVLRNSEAGGDYALRFSPAAFWTTASFYGSRILLHPAGLVLIAAALWRNSDRRAWWGLAAAGAFLAPMVPLPSRMNGAYMYAAASGLAVLAAATLARFPAWVAAAFFAVWLPLNYLHMRRERKHELNAAHENRVYHQVVAALPAKYASVHKFYFDGHPEGMRWWGARAALRMAYRDPALEIEWLGARNAGAIVAAGDAAVLTWNPSAQSLSVLARGKDEPDAAEIVMGPDTPIWQLGEGWYQPEHKYRWTQPRAAARLRRPDDARAFRVVVNVGPRYIEDVRKSRLRILLNSVEIGTHEFDRSGWQTVTFPLPPAPAGPARVEFLVTPEYHPPGDPRVLGLAIGSFGFAPAVQEKHP